MTYLELDVERDRAALAQRAIDYMREAFPGWAAEPGSYEHRFFGANAILGAETNELAAIVATEIFKYQGVLFNLPPLRAAAATCSSTWTMSDTAGYTIPQGTAVQLGVGDQAHAFLTQDAATIPVGESTASIVLVAAEVGAAGNGLDQAALVDLAWRGAGQVESIAVADATSGGADAEPIDVYLKRLVDLFQLQAPRPIKPEEFATLARAIPTVYRALAIDEYNPDDDSFDNARMVAVWCITDTGEAVSGDTLEQVHDLLSSRREVTFVVNVVPEPTYTSIDVEFTAMALPGWDADDVGARANAAVVQFLSPATWGASLSGDLRAWRNVNVVRIGQLEAAIDRVEGLDYVQTLTVNGGTDDVTLDGVASLPQPGSIGNTINTP